MTATLLTQLSEIERHISDKKITKRKELSALVGHD